MRMPFISAFDGLIGGARAYRGARDTNACIRDAQGVLVASCQFEDGVPIPKAAPGAWHEVTFTEPILLSAGSTYTITMHEGLCDCEERP